MAKKGLPIKPGLMPDVVYTFCREVGERYRPAIGRGAAQQHRQWYNRPTQKGLIVRHIGEGFHLSKVPAEKLQLAEVNADHWKSWVHQRLSTPLGGKGAMTFFQASTQEHLALAKYLTAEVKTEEFVAGKGVVEKWERIRKQNHWLDTLYNASAAGHLGGVRLVDDQKKVAKERRSLEKMAEMARRPTARELAAGRS
jgi:hypothetical protein